MVFLDCACATTLLIFWSCFLLLGCHVLVFSLARLPALQNSTVGDETGYNVDVWSLARVQSIIENILSYMYLEHVELFFTANGVPDNKRVPIFLSVVGGTTYTLLRDLLAPEKQEAKDIIVLFKTLINHYERA